MKKIKIAIVLGLVFILAVAMAIIPGCKTAEKSATAGEKVKVGFMSQAVDIEFFIWLTDGMKAKAKELNADLILTDAKYAPEKQISDVRDAIAMGAKAISTILIEDTEGPVIKEICDKAGVPLIASDTPIEGALYLGADNYYCGEITGKWAADYIIKTYNGGKNLKDIPLIIILDLPQYQACIDRADGFLAPIVEKVPAFKDYTLEDLRKNGDKNVVVNYDSGFTQADSEKVMADVITANPRDSYIVFASADDQNAAGAVLALEAAGLDKNSIVVGQSGSGSVFLKMIADPNSCFTATTSYFPYKQGEAIVAAMVRLANGEKLTSEDIKYSEHALTTKENVKEQYPDIFK
jgi:ABC-type sugar transport system substrate-binding protein